MTAISVSKQIMVQDLSDENEFGLQENKNLFSYDRFNLPTSSSSRNNQTGSNDKAPEIFWENAHQKF